MGDIRIIVTDRESKRRSFRMAAHGRGDYPHKYIQRPLCEPGDVDNVIMRAWANETRAENSSRNRD